MVSASPAVADVTWQSLGKFSAGSAPMNQPQVAVDARGVSVYVWEVSEGTLCSGGPCRRVQTRSRSAAGVLSPVQTISTQGQQTSFPQVAVDANGDAWFVWQHFDGTINRIQARSRSAAGVWGGTWTLSVAGRNTEFSKVAVDPNGNAVLVWQYIDGTHWRIQARTASLAGAHGSWQTLSAAGQDAEYPQVAIDGGGNAVFAWQRFDGSHQQIQTRVRSAAGTLAGTHTLSAAGQDASEAHVAVDPSGDAVFAWVRFDGKVNRIQTRARSASGTLSSTQTLSDPGQNADQPWVGVDLAGNAVIVWQRFNGLENLVQTRARSAAGALSPTQTLAGTGTTVPVRAELAADPRGNVLVAWEHRGATAACCTSVQARLRLANGTLGVTRTLSTAGKDAQEPQVAVDPNGHAFAVWHEATTAVTPDAQIHAAVGSF